MGYEKIRETDPREPEEDGHRPAEHRALADQPAGRAEERRRQGAVRPFDLVRPWDSLSEDEKTLMRPDGRGVRRLLQLHRPRDRAADRLPRADRRARQHADRLDLRQRRLRRGRPERFGQREQVLQRRPGRHGRRTSRCSTCSARRRPTTTTPTGWAMAFNTPVQAVQAPHLGGRRRRPDGRALAQGHQGQGRDPRPVHPLHRRRARRSTSAWASSCPRRSRATPSGRSRARASGTASTTPRPRRRSRASST